MDDPVAIQTELEEVRKRKQLWLSREGIMEYDGNEVRSLEHFDSGAQRTSVAERFDLLCPTFLFDMARSLNEGAKKYGVGNWTKGIPEHDLINHALRHLLQYLKGDRSEDHLTHACNNLMFLKHFQQECACEHSFDRAGSNTNPTRDGDGSQRPELRGDAGALLPVPAGDVRPEEHGVRDLPGGVHGLRVDEGTSDVQFVPPPPLAGRVGSESGVRSDGAGVGFVEASADPGRSE